MYIKVGSCLEQFERGCSDAGDQKWLIRRVHESQAVTLGIFFRRNPRRVEIAAGLNNLRPRVSVAATLSGLAASGMKIVALPPKSRAAYATD